MDSPARPSSSNTLLPSPTVLTAKIPLFNVYTPQYLGVINHTGIFVQTAPDGSGELFHVIGNIGIHGGGMKFERRAAANPPDDLSRQFVPGTQVLVGRIAGEELGRMEEICRGIPPPGPQLTLGGKKINPAEPVRRCGDWMREAVQELKRKGLLV